MRPQTIHCCAIVVNDSDIEEATNTPKKKGKSVNLTEKSTRHEELSFLNEFSHTGKTPVRNKGKEKESRRTSSRRSSQVPEGEFINATHISTPRPTPSPLNSPNPSDMDWSSSDESEPAHTPSVQSKHRKSSKKNQKDKPKKKDALKNALSSLQMKPPMVYDGRADLDHFDQWVFEIDTWRDLYDLSEDIVIKLMVNFVSHLAGRFYMKHVAKCQDEWTLKEIYEGTFDYCFPVDFKSKLREELTNADQNDTKVRDFVRELQTLALRFPDVTSRQLNQIFWEGLNMNIRLELIGKGLNPEKDSLIKILKYAVCIENQEEARRLEESRLQSRIQEDESEESTEERNNKIDDESDEDSPKSKPAKSSRQQYRRRDGLSQEEKEQLQAEGKCFNCREVGHSAQNCNQRKTAKAPHITTRNGGISFPYLETLAELKRQANLPVSAARFQVDSNEPTLEPMNVVKEVLPRVQKAFVNEPVPDRGSSGGRDREQERAGGRERKEGNQEISNSTHPCQAQLPQSTLHAPHRRHTQSTL